MQIRCDGCGRGVTVADTGVLPERCPHCRGAPVPATLGRWRIERLLAAGGMGEVYVARHATLGTEVAIKLLPHGPAGVDPEALRERFAREARLTAAIPHPGVVRVIDFDAAGDRAFLVLELVDGRSLRSLLRDGPLAIDRAVAIVRDVADVLAAAHARGVVHRDIKPENVVVGRDGRIRVLDFGIAKALADEQPITRTGEILGTPEYMAPEQLLEGAEAIDARTDVHALGVLAFELLTGRSPFAGHGLFQVLKLVESLEPPAASSLRREVPAELDAVVARALAKDPGERFDDAAAFAAALPGGLASASPVSPARGASRLASGAIGLAGIVLGAVLGLTQASIGWSPSSTGDPAVGPRVGPDPRTVDAEALLRTVAVDPSELRRARAALAVALAAATAHAADEAAARAALGRIDLRLGGFERAALELRRAAELGDPDAAELGVVAAGVSRLVLPALAGAPGWLASDAAEVGPPDEGEDPADAVAGAGRWSRAIEASRAGRAAEAFAMLRDGASDAPDGVRALAVFAAACAVPDAARVRAYAARLRPAEPGPAFELATALPESPAVRLAALERQVDRTPPDSADRWLAELCRARLAAELGVGAPRRLAAAAELAWLHGAGHLAMRWYTALRLDLVAHGHPLADDEARSLLRLVAAAPPSPAQAAVLGLARIAAREPGDVWAELRAMVPATPPALRALAALSVDDACGQAVGRLWLGEAALPGADRAAVDSAEQALLRAVHGPDDQAAAAFGMALCGGADPGVLEFVPPRRAPAPAALAAGLRAALAKGVAAESLWPAIRAAARAGTSLDALLAAPELAALRAVMATEVFAGLPD